MDHKSGSPWLALEIFCDKSTENPFHTVLFP